jgi:hypothetical protein
MFAWLISHQPAVLFSHNKPATSNQPAVLFSQNKSAPAINHQPTEQAASRCSAAGVEQVPAPLALATGAATRRAVPSSLIRVPGECAAKSYRSGRPGAFSLVA